MDHVYKIEIMQGQWHMYVTCMDEFQYEYGLRGRVYQDPTIPSIDRVFRAVSGANMDLEISRDGRSPVITAWRKPGSEQ